MIYLFIFSFNQHYNFPVLHPIYIFSSFFCCPFFLSVWGEDAAAAATCLTVVGRIFLDFFSTSPHCDFYFSSVCILRHWLREGSGQKTLFFMCLCQRSWLDEELSQASFPKDHFNPNILSIDSCWPLWDYYQTSPEKSRTFIILLNTCDISKLHPTPRHQQPPHKEVYLHLYIKNFW